MVSANEDSIRADIRNKFKMVYYAEVRNEDQGRSARFVRWGEKHWKKIALGFASAFAVAVLPVALFTVLPVTASALATAETFCMLVSSLAMLTGLASMATFCTVDSRLVSKGLKKIDADIDNGTLLEPYKKGLLAAREAEHGKLTTALDKLLAKAETSGAFKAVTAPAEEAAQNVQTAAQLPQPDLNVPAKPAREEKPAAP